MPTCTECGGTEFTEDCGHFYCKICHVQSQDIRVEESEFQEVHKIVISKKPTAKKSQEKKKEDKIKELGRPWTVYEGYECVIKKQVQSLIEMGADKKLDEIVFRCWTAYLSALEVAFCDNERLFPARNGLTARPREGDCGTIENPVVTAKYRKKSHLASKKAVEKMEITRELGSEVFYDEDNPALMEEDLKGINSDDKADPTIIKGTQQRQRKNIEWLNMSQTLSFLYLGLLFTNNHVTPSEIIRMAETNQIPYASALTCLKDDMKLSSFDGNLFSTTIIPTTKQLRLNTSQLVRFLSLFEMPPLPFDLVLSKLILKLDLPGEFQCLVRQLLNLRELDMAIDTDRSIRDVEQIAACYIIMALKLYYGVNDSTEHTLTECVRKLIKLLPKHNLFVWEDWQSYMSSKYKVKEQVVNHFARNAEGVTDVDEFVKLHKLTIKTKKSKKEKQFEAVIPNISEFAKRMKSSQSEDTDIKMETQDTLDILDVHDTPDSSTVTKSESEKPGQQFRCSSIKYFISTEEIIGNRDKEGDDCYATDSSCTTDSGTTDSSCTSVSSNYSDDLSDTQHRQKKKKKHQSQQPIETLVSHSDDLSDTQHTQKKKKKKKNKKKKKHQSQQPIETLVSHADGTQTFISRKNYKKIEKIVKVIQNHSGEYRHYNIPKKVISDSNVKDIYVFQRNISYEWLLSLFCKVIRCRMDDLEYMLYSFERSLFENSRNFNILYFSTKYFKK